MQDLPTVINPTPTYVIGVKDGGLVLVPISADLKGGGEVAQYGIVVGTVAAGQPNAGTGGGGGSTTFAALTDATTATIPTTNTPTATALALKAPLASPALTGSPTAPTQTQADNSTKIATTAYVDTLGATKAAAGKVGREADVTASRAFASTDFGVGIVPLNASTVLAMTLPTVASMGLSGSGNVLPVQVMGTGIPTFAGATASTTINGVAGTTTVTPLGGAPVRYGLYVFTQISSTDAWTLN